MVQEIDFLNYPFIIYITQKDNQKDLETATEQLSEYLERNIAWENAVEVIVQKVQDQFRYCEMRRKALAHHIAEGYEKQYWKFIE